MQLPTIFQYAALLGLTNAVVLPSRRSPESIFSPSKRQSVCSDDEHGNQQTTYYTSGTSPTGTTACGTQYDTAGMTAAISTELESAIGGIDNACGRGILVFDALTGNEVQLTIEDSNATGDLGEYALDVTPTAYEALGGSTDDSDPGQRTITWYLDDGGSCF